MSHVADVAQLHAASAEDPLHGPGEHWLDMAERRFVEVELRIALTIKLFGGMLGGAHIGVVGGTAAGNASFGFALGALIGAAVGRLWHEIDVRRRLNRARAEKC
ncbi:MAG: hypothetical protein AB7I36_07265 [Rhodospirillaceae bacterium]